MYHNRKLSHKINGIHERALRMVYKDKKCTFNELLQKDKLVTIHISNLQTLATDMYKVKNKSVADLLITLQTIMYFIMDIRIRINFLSWSKVLGVITTRI